MEDEFYLTFWKTPYPLQFEMIERERKNKK